MVNTELRQFPRLPVAARLMLNRCNLPAEMLGSVGFQKTPQTLWLDSVAELHNAFFCSLHSFDHIETRVSCFRDYMRACFLLDYPDQAGLNLLGNFPRPKADYLRLLRGWMFDSDSQEAAVLKGWVESRFGLLTRYHLKPLGDYHSHEYRLFQSVRARGLYNTNALEAQLDLLYAWGQYEYKRRYPDDQHVDLFRGTNFWNSHEVLQSEGDNRFILLLNNLNSFTGKREYAHAFGDHLISAQIPVSKLLYFPGLLPGILPGEYEYLVIGGLYDVKRLS